MPEPLPPWPSPEPSCGHVRLRSVCESDAGMAMALAEDPYLALTALTGFAWSLAGLNRIDLFIEPRNAGSIRTAERSGYIRRGFRSGYQLAGGGQRDMLVFSATRSGGP